MNNIHDFVPYRIMTVDVGNKELVEVHVPKTGKAADIMQQLRRWDKDLHGRSLANENGAALSITYGFAACDS